MRRKGLREELVKRVEEINKETKGIVIENRGNEEEVGKVKTSGLKEI